MHLKGGVLSLMRTMGNSFMSKTLGKLQFSVAISEKFLFMF